MARAQGPKLRGRRKAERRGRRRKCGRLPARSSGPWTDLASHAWTLSYSRISEKDRFDTGLVVPVWGFRGTRKEVYEGNAMNPVYYTQMAINAIDGSIIDAALGY